MSKINAGTVTTSIEEEWKATVIPTLEKYIRIPNQSPSWEAAPYPEINNAAKLLATWATDLKLERTTVNLVATSDTNPRTPIILVEVQASKTTNVANVLMYGHLDKQPPMHNEDTDGDGIIDKFNWTPPAIGPYEPKRVWDETYKSELLYGRGGADDGYSIFAALTSIQALQKQSVPHDRYVVLIEASEESGSPHLASYLVEYKSTIEGPMKRVDLIVCLDSGSSNYDQVFLTTSLRGVIGATVRADIMTSGMHSGVASGIVPETFRIQRNLIDRIEKQDGTFNTDFVVEIPENRVKEAQELAVVLGPDFYKTQFPWFGDAQPVSTDATTLLLNKSWRPSLCVIGADGIPPPASGGNVLRPYTTFKISLRLPPTLDAVAAEAKLKALVTQDPPYKATITYTPEEPGQGWDSPALAPWLAAALEQASTQIFGKTFVAQGEGGSIPFMAMLGDEFPEAQFTITGVLGPNSNAHAGNEMLNLGYAQRLTGAIAIVLANLAEKHVDPTSEVLQQRRQRKHHKQQHQEKHHH